MTDFEERLGEVLASKSAEAPPANGLAEAARARHRHRRGALIGATAAVAVAALLTAGTALATRDDGPGTSSPSNTPTAAVPTTSPNAHDTPTCAELDQAPPAALTQPVPDKDAQHTAVNASGTVAAWFNQSRLLPELIVFDLARTEELAREDLGVADVADNPSLRILGQALYYRSAADPDVWMRYAWAEDTYPLVYSACN